MRFAVALVALLAAAVLILTGVAQRTILRPPDHVRVAATVPAGVDYVVVPSSVLRAHPGQQRLHLSGTGTTFAAYGRTTDLTSWLSGERYALLRVDGDGRMLAPVVRTAPAVAGVAGGTSPDPDGADTWMDQRSGTRTLDWNVNLPASVSMLVASDGRAAAPSSVRLEWPVRASTPFALPLIVAGGGLAVLGLLLYIWALVHVRRRRGPRRKSPPKAPRRPQPPKFRPQKPVATGPGRGRRSESRPVVHRMMPALGLLAAAAVLSATGAAQPAEAASAPAAAVSEAQAKRIVLRTAETAEKADAALDAKLIATRFEGPALALRTAAYRVRAKDKKAAMPPALPVEQAEMQLILPEATDSWPRTLFAVVVDTSRTKAAPLALTLIQADPRADYKVRYSMELRPGITLPNLPSALLGASLLAPDTGVLRVPPSELAAAYGAVLRHGDAAQAAAFDTDGDPLVAKVGEAAKAKAARKLGSTAGITYKDLTGDASDVVAMSTADAGALVAVELQERTTVKPKRSGVTVQTSGGVKTLSKHSSSARGIAAVYGYQLLFSVPSAGSKKPVVLLGYAQGLISAKEL